MTAGVTDDGPASLAAAGRACLALALVAMTGAGARGDEGRWVGTWAASPQRTEPANMPPAPGLADTTLRQVVHVSLGGKRLRVRFSNAFGAKPLTILSAQVATPAGGAAIRAESRKPLAFGGRTSVTIPPGAPMVSDPVDFDLAPLSDLAVTLRVKDSDGRGHRPSGSSVHLVSASRRRGRGARPAAGGPHPHWYYICGVDVDAPDAEAAAVAVLGDSITDGRGSPTDGNGRWTDHLARRLHEGEGTARVGVLNQGLGGNRLLNDGLGPNALARLDRDVLAQPGVRWLIVLEGINDLGTHSATAADLIAATSKSSVRAHARGIKVYGATILPCEGSFYFSAELEAARQEVNAWVRGSGRFDAVIDFDAATRDRERPLRLSAAADGGDHLHPGPEGYRIMAGAVDLELFGLPIRRVE